MQLSSLLELLGCQTGIPKGLEKNQKFQRGGGVNYFGIQRDGPGIEHFTISVGKGGGGEGCKVFMLPM